MDLRFKFITIILAGTMAGCSVLQPVPSEPGLKVDPKNYSLSDVPGGTIVLDLPSQTIKAIRFNDDGSVNSLWNTSENVRYRQVCNVESWQSGNVNRQREIKRVWRNGSDDYIPTERVEQVYDSAKEMIAALRAEKLPDNQMIKIRCNLAEKGPVFISTQRLRDGCAVVSIGDRTHVLQVLPDWFGGGHIKSMTLRSSPMCGTAAGSILDRFGKQLSLDTLPRGAFAFQNGKLVAWRRDPERDRLGYKIWHFINIDTGLVAMMQGSWRDNDNYRDGRLAALGVPNNKPTKHECIRNLTPGAQYAWASAWVQRNDSNLRIYDTSIIAAAKCEQPK